MARKLLTYGLGAFAAAALLWGGSAPVQAQQAQQQGACTSECR